MYRSCDDIRQRTVIDSAGIVIGDVDTLLMDDTSWRVDALRVRLRRDLADQLGAERSRFRRATIDVPTALIQSVGDAVILSVTADQLRPPAPPAPPSELRPPP